MARGEQGWVWRLTTSSGAWAVKEPFYPQAESEVDEDADYQDAVREGGVPAPVVVRTTNGGVLLDVGGAQVRLYEWVDLNEADITLDPVEVGCLVALIHRVRFAGDRPVDPWYTDPVGADRWDAVVLGLRQAGAPFAEDLAELRDELVALESLLEPPADLQTCHRDLWADNIRRTPEGGLCVIDWENCGLADPGQELSGVLFELATSRRGRALYEAYIGAGGPGEDRPARLLLDDHRPTGSHPRDLLPALA